MSSGYSAFSEAREKFLSATLCSLPSANLKTNSTELRYPRCISVIYKYIRIILMAQEVALIYRDKAGYPGILSVPENIEITS